MRIKNIFFLAIVISNFSFGQISTREVVINKEVAKPIIYDSTYFGYRSFERNKAYFKQYIGQEIYILPISKNDTNRVYRDFYRQENIGSNEIFSSQNTFKPTIDTFGNQYLKIIDCRIRHDKWYLVLLNNSDTLYYHPSFYSYLSISELPFILTAFYEKSKIQYLNKTFISKKEIETIEINTGEKLIIQKNEKWKCTDVTLIDLDYRYQVPILVFQNLNGNEIAISFVKYINYEIMMGDELVTSYYPVYYLEQFSDPNEYKEGEEYLEIDDFLTTDEYEILSLQKQEQDRLKRIASDKLQEKRSSTIMKYGDYYGNLINENKISIGMSTKMCELSWGNPISVNEVITEDGKHLVWQYDYKTILYFKDNILKIIKQ